MKEKGSHEKFSVEDIRPASLTAKQAEKFSSDISRLLRRKSEFVSVACPACQTLRSRPAFRKQDLQFVECEECETVYMNPRPTLDILAEYYSTSENYEYWNTVLFPATEEARREKIFRPRVSRILEICRRNSVGTGCLVEVGAGYGIFCEEIGKAGVFQRVIAIEPTPSLAERCRAKGLEVIEKPVEKVRLDAIADVVASFEVIEHLFSPMEFIRSCHEMLVPNGMLVLTCPNIKGFDMMVLRERSSAVDVEHMNLFHPGSLGSLVGSLGFEVLEMQTPGQLDVELVRNSVLAGEFDIDGHPFLKRVLFDDWERIGNNFQKFLSENLLSSHMWIVAKKRQK
ncbi:MAG: class I SAM-dependent methyltransferase [Deltaproteobacteria bacterium]|nr:class I SAM-dependent methyltransferase [Deltaproteobacteria bacterium]MDH3384278.1 class I SAM-dependent methyltransferase [Deltaproteobacteria bacterium]